MYFRYSSFLRKCVVACRSNGFDYYFLFHVFWVECLEHQTCLYLSDHKSKSLKLKLHFYLYLMPFQVCMVYRMLNLTLKLFVKCPYVVQEQSSFLYQSLHTLSSYWYLHIFVCYSKVSHHTNELYSYSMSNSSRCFGQSLTILCLYQLILFWRIS